MSRKKREGLPLETIRRLNDPRYRLCGMCERVMLISFNFAAEAKVCKSCSQWNELANEQALECEIAI